MQRERHVRMIVYDVSSVIILHDLTKSWDLSLRICER